VALYRVYWIGRGGHFEAAEYIECASHEEARTRALEVMGAFAKIEIWLGAQLIAQLPSERSTAELRERAAEYRHMAKTARSACIEAALLRLADRYGAVADRRERLDVERERV
jgi:hypothetical protein